MSKATAFNPARYRNNPKLIAKYLTHALASDDTAFYNGSDWQPRARTRNGGYCRRGERRSRRSIQIASWRHGPRVQHNFEGADCARRAVGGRAGLVRLKRPLADEMLKIVASGDWEDLNNI